MHDKNRIGKKIQRYKSTKKYLYITFVVLKS